MGDQSSSNITHINRELNDQLLQSTERPCPKHPSKELQKSFVYQDSELIGQLMRNRRMEQSNMKELEEQQLLICNDRSDDHIKGLCIL